MGCLLLLATTALVAQTAMSSSAPVSPTITKLQSAVSRHSENAEQDFWSQIQKTGTPLVESIANDSHDILVTFLWRGDSETHNVVLVNTAIASSDFRESQLTRIDGTNVWYRTYPARPDARFAYELSINDSMVPFEKVTDWGKRTSTFHLDPLNPHSFRSTIMGGRELSYFEGPKAPAEPWIKPVDGAPKGHVEETKFVSKQLGNTRELWVYTPPGFDSRESKQSFPLLLVFDGGEYVSSVPTPTILDNLVAAKRITPVIAIFVGNPDGQRDSELIANPQFADFIAGELIPWAKERYPISSSPDKNIVAGSSAGGLAAAFVAFRHPEIFGNVLSQSGAYFFAPPEDDEPEILPRTLSTSALKSIRFYVEVGTLEGNGESFKGVNMLSSNRHFRDVLLAKGYPLTYHEFVGGHSDLNWRSGFASGILALSDVQKSRTN